MKEVGFHIQSIISGRMIGQMAVLLAFLISIGSCGSNQQKKSDETGDTVRMKYAENITIVKYSDQTVVELKDPWNKGKVLHRYVFPKDKLPLTHNVVFNTAHASLIGMLHADDKIVGVADLKYMNLPAIHRRIG
jgi:iron complex transport system substrate-binding protein